jgi:hypothetical protein
MIALDKYARDYQLWRDYAAFNYHAAILLFESENPFAYFPAATLGHHALEMYLKSSLIVSGMTVFNPKKVKELDPSIVLAERDCAWGHNLVALGKQLAARTADLQLAGRLPIMGLVVLQEPMTVEEGFAIFDPFFTELRYPQENKLVTGLGHEHGFLLKALVEVLQYVRGRVRLAAAP